MQTIQLYNLSIGYGKHAVVSDINSTLNSGRLTCLLGRNGVGKSTLLRTLAGFIPPVAGKIYIQGTHLERLSHQELAEKNQRGSDGKNGHSEPYRNRIGGVGAHALHGILGRFVGRRQ